MPVKLNDDKIKYVIREKKKGTPNATMAENMKISSRHVRRIWAKYRSTGSLPTISSGGRPATKVISDEEVEMMLAECRDLIRYYFPSLPTLLFRPISVRQPVLPATAAFEHMEKHPRRSHGSGSTPSKPCASRTCL